MHSIRHKRLEKRLLVLTADIYQREMSDLVRGFVTFTRCTLSKDCSQFCVYFSIYASSHGVKARAVKNLNALISVLSRSIAKNIRMRRIPFIQFREDILFQKEQQIYGLLEKDKSNYDSNLANTE